MSELARMTRRGGRPRRNPEPGERVATSFRVTPAMKRPIETAAADSGRSLSQEAELLLELGLRERRLERLELELGLCRRQVLALQRSLEQLAPGAATADAGE